MIRTVLTFLGDVLDVAGMAVLVALIILVFWIMDLLPGHEPAYHRRTG